MGHSHSHDHGHSHSANKKALFISFLCITTFMIIEVIGGFLTNSLALLSDAGHMLSDSAALGLSLVAFIIGEKAATGKNTFGFRRFEILAAFFNGIALLAISIYILWEAYHRFFEPQSVSAGMLYIASLGFLVNVIVAWILMKGDTHDNLNMKSALLHVFGDLLGSVGAIIAGLLILFFDWSYADPIASVIVSFLILNSGWRVTKDSFHILMEGKPHHINFERVEIQLKNLPGVSNVHDLHVWTLTSDLPLLSCHLVVDETVDRDSLLQQASALLLHEFNLKHTTIQIEGAHSKIQETENYCN